MRIYTYTESVGMRGQPDDFVEVGADQYVDLAERKSLVDELRQEFLLRIVDYVSESDMIKMRGFARFAEPILDKSEARKKLPAFPYLWYDMASGFGHAYGYKDAHVPQAIMKYVEDREKAEAAPELVQ